MAEPLLLVAAGGLAREVLAAVRMYGGFDVVGFLDDSPALVGAMVDGLPVLGPLDAIATLQEPLMLVCAGHGRAREGIVDRLDALGVSPQRYATFVHPSAEVSDGCEVGAGSVVLAGVVMTASVVLGEHVVVMPNVTLTHDDVLQDFATVCAGVALGGAVVVGRGAYLGMGSSVRERRLVGAGATLGMGAVLVEDLPPGQTWAGVPARPLHTADELRVTDR